MPLKKYFLRRNPVFNKRIVITSILLGTLLSYVLYYFFYIGRETLRIFTEYFGPHFLLILNPRENFLYNTFYASISCCIALHLSIKFITDNSFNRKDKKIKYRLRQISHEQSVSAWVFLSVIGRYASVLGIWHFTMSIAYDLVIIKDYWLLLILVPLTMFLNAWVSVLRLLGRRTFRYMGYTVVYLALLSLIFASLDRLDYQKLNEKIVANNVIRKYDLEVPRSIHFKRVRRLSLTQELYVVRDSLSRSLILWDKHDQRQVEIKDIGAAVEDERNLLWEYERDYFMPILQIDKRIQMSLVNRIFDELRKNNVEYVFLSTGVKYSKYPSYYPPFQRQGIQRPLRHYFPEMDSFLLKARNINFTKNRIKTNSESWMYATLDSFKEYKPTTIAIKLDSIFVNGKPTSKSKLREYCNKYINIHAPDYLFIYEPDEDISYDRYIEYYDLLHTCIDNTRNKVSIERTSKRWEDLSQHISPEDSVRKAIRSKYPTSIFHWTREDKELHKLLKKQDEYKEGQQLGKLQQ